MDTSLRQRATVWAGGFACFKHFDGLGGPDQDRMGSCASLESAHAVSHSDHPGPQGFPVEIYALA